jgi:hypothetical protein
LIGIVQLARQPFSLALVVNLFENPFEDIDHLGLTCRPDEVIGGSQTESLNDVDFLALRRKKNDRDGQPLRSQRHQQVFSTQSGQIQISNNGIRRKLHHAIDGCGSIRHYQILVAGRLQDLPSEHVADDWIIFDNKNTVARSGHALMIAWINPQRINVKQV